MRIPYDTENHYAVSITAGSGILHILNPPGPRGMHKNEALVLAAWLVCLADPLGERWEEVLAAVRGT